MVVLIWTVVLGMIWLRMMIGRVVGAAIGWLGMARCGTTTAEGWGMNVGSIGVAIPMAAVQPRTVVEPPTGSIINAATAFHIATACDATAQDKFHRREKQQTQENFADNFHGRVAGLALSTYSTRPIVPPVESAMMANRLS